MPKNTQPVFRTRIEQRFAELLAKEGQPLPRAKEATWFFSANFAQAASGGPQGYLRRYEKGDVMQSPSEETVIPGKVVGEVRFENGHAVFNGNGHLEFEIGPAPAQMLRSATVTQAFLTPKPLIMLGVGQVNRAAYVSNAYANPFVNPILYYRSGDANFGLFVPDGSMVSKVNQEVLHATTGFATRDLTSAVWYAQIVDFIKNAKDGKRFLYAHDIIDDVAFEYVSRRDFFLYEPLTVPLTPGSVFYVGNAPLPGVAPMRGWLEEVIFDPAGGAHNGGGK